MSAIRTLLTRIFTFRFLLAWLRCSVGGATTAAFGWATILSGGALFSVGSQFGYNFSSASDAYEIFRNTLLGALAAWVIGFTINALIFSPFSAYRLLFPLTVRGFCDNDPSEFVRSAKADGHLFLLSVENRSAVHLLDCVALVSSVGGVEEDYFPRFVEKFDIPPQSTKRIPIAYWWSRKPPNGDDNGIGISGPPGNGFGGNILRTNLKSSIISVQLKHPNIPNLSVEYKVWIDGLKINCAKYYKK